jgi:ABC-type uncharacterized transport system fused permease/ATPase subunit
MTDPKKGDPGSISGKLKEHYKHVCAQLEKHIGYDVAKRGWDNDSPMSGSPKLDAVKDVFKYHAKRPWMLISPVLWSEFATDLSKAIAPDKDSKLLPGFDHSGPEKDFGAFKPDEALKQRLLKSTSLETSRSFTRSFLKITGMYLTKAGPRELSIALTLAALTLYTSYESVNVLAEFSNWGRDFNNFYVAAGGTAQAFKTGILDTLKAAYELKAFAPVPELVETIVKHGAHNLDTMDVAKAISHVKINPETIAQITGLIKSQLGSLSIDTFSNGEHLDDLRKILSQTNLPFKQSQEVLDAIQNGVQIKASAAESIEKIQTIFADFDFETLNHAIGLHEDKVKDLQTGLKALHAANEEQIRLVQSGLNMTLPENIEKIQHLLTEHAKQAAPLEQGLEKLQRQYEEIIQPLKSQLDTLLAPDILNAKGVQKSTDYLAGSIPGQFSLLLGKFLIYALPAFYTAQHLALRWQTWMTGKLCNEWNKYNAAYKIRFGHTNIDNPDQRIQENLSSITDFVVSTSTEGMQNALQLAIFLPMLGAMGSFNPAFLGGPDITIDNFLTWSALGYATVGTGALGAIAYSLPKMKRRIQEAVGNFRAALISVHSQPEQIALARGSEQEKKILKEKFDPVVEVSRQFISKGTQMKTFNSIHGNVGSYLPLLLAAPQYLAGIIDFGQVSQAAGIFRRVEGSFEFIKENISPFSSFKAALDRTAQLVDALELARYEELERKYYQQVAERQIAAHPPEEAPALG